MRVINDGGLRAATSETICDEADLDVGDLWETYGSRDALISDTVDLACGLPVFPRANPDVPVTTVASTLAWLAVTHRTYVARVPERFGMITQLVAPALLGHTEFVTALAARNRRSRAAVATHLWVLRSRGIIDPQSDLESIASTVVDTFVGIETCFLIDDDPWFRDRAYAEAVVVFTALLTPRG